MKYKVGDKVKVKEWEDLKSQYGVDEYGEINVGIYFVEDMKQFCGKELVIETLGFGGYLCKGNDWIWEDWMFEDVKPPTLEDITLKFSQVPLISESIKIVYTHEDTIINLNDLNTTKSRQIERLMKFIAKDYTITNDLDYDLIRETLLKDIRDEDLVNAIMYHVRKGK